LSVESFSEHQFIQNWLRTNDPSEQRWLTSGRRNGIFWQWVKRTGPLNFQFDQGWLPYTQEEQQLRLFLLYAFQSTTLLLNVFFSKYLFQVVNGVGYHLILDPQKSYPLFVKHRFEKLMVFWMIIEALV